MVPPSRQATGVLAGPVPRGRPVGGSHLFVPLAVLVATKSGSSCGLRSHAHVIGTAQRRITGVLRRYSNAVAAVLSTGLAAASSFALQLVAARTLGAAGLGRFSLLTSTVITVAALHAGWVGDSLTVLDRFAPATRAALIRVQQGAVVLALVLGSIGVAAFRVVGPGVAVAFGLALALWLLEDTGRRILMARGEFWQAVLNDGVYAVAALGFLAGVAWTGNALSLATLVWAIAVGSGAACVAAVIQLPRQELAPAPAGTVADLRGLSAFAAWRAAQIALRPAGLFVMRALVAAWASSVALGRLEGARLLLAPVLVVINGAGFALLPSYARRFREGTFSVASVRKAMAALCGLSLAAGALALLSLPVVGPLVTGDSFELSPVAVVSWTLLMAASGAGLPSGLAVVASGRARQTFVIRTADTGAGLLMVLVAMALGAPELAPAGLAVGAVLGAGWLLKVVTQLPPTPVQP